MELIKASVGARNIHITMALLLSAAHFFFFFFVAAAQSSSVLKLPTEANSTAMEAGNEACCDKCGFCISPSLCSCRDVHEKCPSWCTLCLPVAGGGNMCLDLKPNYCKNNCRQNGICCDKCGPFCYSSLPPICSCQDVMDECPSWCHNCVDFEGRKVCRDFLPNYCEKTCY